MPDRLMVITQLGALVEVAEQRGDDRASSILRDAIELLVDGATLDRRRRVDRERKRLKPSADSAESVESVDVRIRPLGFSPTPPFPTPPDSTTPTPRARDARGDENAQLTDGLISLVSQSMGARWPDVDAFVRRREYHTWAGWLKAMQTALVSGGATPDDVAEVCRDDAALTNPVGSPKGFRAFVASAVRERHATTHASAPKSVPGAGRAVMILSQIRGMVKTSQQPGQRAISYIPKADVQALGVDVFRAYEGIGGAERIISTNGENMSFLLRDFTAALEGAA